MLLNALWFSGFKVKGFAHGIDRFVLGLMISAHQKFSNKTHQDGLEAQDEEHDAHLEKG